MRIDSAADLNITAIDKAMGAKYSHRAAQEKVIDKQIAILKLSAMQGPSFEPASFYFSQKNNN